MAVPPSPPSDPDDGITISSEDARQGEIILRTRKRQIVFIAGLVGFAILAIFGGNLFA